MHKRSRMRIALIMILTAGMILPVFTLYGCGGNKTDISYDKSGSKPVVIYRTSQAIAPIYNPGAPTIIIYGDGTVIKKKDSYVFTQGKLGSGALEKILDDLDSEGFFGLKNNYSGKGTMTGGITELLTVNLLEGKHEVTVEKGAGPKGWDAMVDSVVGVDITGSEEYAQSEVILYAKEGGNPAGLEVMKWPGDAGDLQKAVASGGARLQGDSAEVAWKAVQDTYKKVDEIVWEGGGKYYTYVYASPVFPGVKD